MNRAMPFRVRFVRPFANRVINPITRRFAGWLPGFGIVTHVGRRSGRVYRTPINVFRRGEHYIFALTYGPQVNWVQNVLTAGQCELTTRGRKVRLEHPSLVVDHGAESVPVPVRAMLRVLRVSEFLVMEAGVR
jgi:deazaflavin-dependent oxidoreductase (nitroreductase family)